jgi:hypothetical protein
MRRRLEQNGLNNNDEEEEEPTSLYEIAVKQDEIEEGMNTDETAAAKMRTNEPKTYQRWRRARDDIREKNIRNN